MGAFSQNWGTGAECIKWLSLRRWNKVSGFYYSHTFVDSHVYYEWPFCEISLTKQRLILAHVSILPLMHVLGA